MLSIINDTHNGAIRSGGTTTRSGWELRQWILQRFEILVSGINTDLLILGDLLDTYSIPYLDLLEVFRILRDWLVANPGCILYLVPGNHDLSRTTTTMSSFEFLASLLGSHPRVEVLSEPTLLEQHDAYVIPHMQNQELFDIELGKVPKVKYLLVHCNYDNKFAQEQDHSLNLSADQALKMPVERIIFAHEHQRRTMMNGKVVVIGNQIPSSVADCLGNDAKYMLQIGDKGIEHLPVWEAAGCFERIDWREIGNVSPKSQFIRVQGEATSVEASEVASVISKLRSVHNAFVITNAVSIEGRNTDGEKASLEKVQAFNVVAALMRHLNPQQAAVVKKLMEDNDVQT